jgi:hypothetical protein
MRSTKGLTTLARVQKTKANGKAAIPSKPKREKLDASSWPKVSKKIERLLALAAGASTEEEARTAAVALARTIDRHGLKVVCQESPEPIVEDALMAPARPGETWASRAGFGEMVGFAVMWQDRRDPFLFGFLSTPSGRPLIFMNPHDGFREITRLQAYFGGSAANGYGVVPVHRF